MLDVAAELMQQLETNAQLGQEALWQPLPADVAKLMLENENQAALPLINGLTINTTHPRTIMTV